MKSLNVYLAFFMAFAMCACHGDNVQSSENILFNDDWNFFRMDSSVCMSGMQLINGTFPEQAVKVQLPHTSRMEPMVVNNQWQGTCYYMKRFTLDDADKGLNLFLKFEGAMNVADVWLNGKHLATHLGGFLPFCVDISADVKYSASNVLVVRLDNEDNRITGPKPLKQLDFNMYGGLYRDVWLIKKGKIYISDPVNAGIKGGGGIYVQTKNITGASADVHVKTHLVNTAEQETELILEHTLFSPDGDIMIRTRQKGMIGACQDKEFSSEFSVGEPPLWTPGNPNLCTLSTKVFVDNTMVDKEDTRIGIREIEVSENGLFLNGEKTFLRGVNRHQEYPYIGYALSNEAQYRDAYKIKNAGFDYVRTSHYPQSPAFLDACDELGIMVLDAILGWQYFGDSLFVEHSRQSARELIRRDRNHPCVLAWELSLNETPMPEYFMESMNDICREEAPDTYTAGWIKGGYDIYIEARQHRTDIDRTVPLLVSEYGDWEYYAQNAGFNQDNWEELLQEERSSRQPRESGESRLLQQVANIQEAHNDNLSTHAFADGYWAMFDYNRGYAEDLEYSGIMDIFRLPKFSYHFFRSQKDICEDKLFSDPMVYIASYWEPGKSKNVSIYSNCDEVELFLDNKSVGRKYADNDAATRNLGHPPFTFEIACRRPGTLEAIGYCKGKRVCSHSVSTAGQPAGIRLRADISGISPVPDDILFVYADILDENGNLVHNASPEVRFQIIRNGQLLGPEHADALGGIATALVKAGRSGSDISVMATSDGLEPDQIEIQMDRHCGDRYPEQEKMSGNPIFQGWYADPEGVVFDNRYWVYLTSSLPFDEQLYMDAFSSDDLVNWEKHPEVLSVENISWLRSALWAPAVIEADGRYYLYFGANDIHSNEETGGIGVAVADNPAGPFKDALGKPLIDKIVNGAQPIDQFVFKDDDGQYYMYYGGWGHCNMVKMGADLISIVPFEDGSMYKEVTPENYTEGPFMLKRNGKYYFMWSEGDWTGPDYSVAYSIADSPYGPFKRMAQILKQDNDIAAGAGHHSVIKVPGKDEWYIVYHRRPLDDTDGNHRVACIDRMYFSQDGSILPVRMTATAY